LLATRKAKLQQYEPGSMILQQGTSGDVFYIVSKGTVEIVLQRPNQSDVIAAQLAPGQYFGEMQLLHGEKRSASARASEHTAVDVLAIDFNTLKELLGESQATQEAFAQVADQRKKQNIELRGDKK